MYAKVVAWFWVSCFFLSSAISFMMSAHDPSVIVTNMEYCHLSVVKGCVAVNAENHLHRIMPNGKIPFTKKLTRIQYMPR